LYAKNKKLQWALPIIAGPELWSVILAVKWPTERQKKNEQKTKTMS
jgi:hypothetical protein